MTRLAVILAAAFLAASAGGRALAHQPDKAQEQDNRNPRTRPMAGFPREGGLVQAVDVPVGFLEVTERSRELRLRGARIREHPPEVKDATDAR